MNIRSDIIGFLYIVKEEKYYRHYRRGLNKIIPEIFVPVSKPKILDHVYDLNEQRIGIVGGIFLKKSNIYKEELIERLVMGIESIKLEDTHSLILEELYLFNKDDIEFIENRTGLQVIEGIDVIVAFVGRVLEDIYRILEDDLRNKEVLIIGNYGDLTQNIIKAICTKVRFVTLIGDYNNDIEDLIIEVLEKTGLSIFYSKSIEKILPNYSIIINLDENPDIDISKIRKQVIMFDLSTKGAMNKLMMNGKGPKAIEDFIFQLNQENIKENQWIEDLMPSYVYEYFYPTESAKLKKICVGGNLYNIEDFADYYVKDRGKL